MLVDDHPLFRKGLADLINAQPDLCVCGEADEAPRAFEMIAELKPETVVTDLALTHSDGMELIKNIKAAWPKMRILVISMHDEALYAERVLRAGGLGYVMKGEGGEQVLLAIRKVLHGEVFLSEVMKGRLLNRCVGGRTSQLASPVAALSDRELEVFCLIGQGHGAREIAEELRLSVRTVEAYREHIKGKLTLKNGTQLVQHAFQHVHEERAA